MKTEADGSDVATSQGPPGAIGSCKKQGSCRGLDFGRWLLGINLCCFNCHHWLWQPQDSHTLRLMSSSVTPETLVSSLLSVAPWRKHGPSNPGWLLPCKALRSPCFSECTHHHPPIRVTLITLALVPGGLLYLLRNPSHSLGPGCG